MTRRGRTLGGVALGVAAALVALPPVAAAQSAVDEYTLDIPGGGGSASGSSGGPSAGAAGSANASGSGGGQRGQGARGKTAAETARDAGGGAAGGAGGAGLTPLHDGAGRTTDTDDRNAPEVVADTLLDGAMLPMLGALALITGIGAWRLLRHRNTPTGAAG